MSKGNYKKPDGAKRVHEAIKKFFRQYPTGYEIVNFYYDRHKDDVYLIVDPPMVTGGP